uniref:Uncharacterized protein n=1 Tax=Amphimedon queenslandica TaxID=400682 RepID=A0A1X7VDQ3_AMPQE
MFTMSAIDPALLILVNIYADKFDQRQDTSVYNNGVMQVSVFVSVNYNGEASEDEIIPYVQDNVVIYSLNYEENVQWEKSTTDNGFHHDIDYAANKNASVPSKSVSDIRVPLYFTVPGGTAEGKHRWIAKLGDTQTNYDTPLTITVKKFDVSSDKLEIVNREEVSCNQLRVLKYKSESYPDSQKLLKCIDYKGIKFIGTGGNVFVSMVMSSKGHKMGCFVDHRVKSNIKIAKSGRLHAPEEMIKQNIEGTGTMNWIDCDCLENSLDLESSDIEQAWNEGVVLVKVHHESVMMGKQYSYDGYGQKVDYELNNFVLEDTFGGRVEVNIDWDVSDWWGNWAVRSAKVVYP